VCPSPRSEAWSLFSLSDFSCLTRFLAFGSSFLQLFFVLKCSSHRGSISSVCRPPICLFPLCASGIRSRPFYSTLSVCDLRFQRRILRAPVSRVKVRFFILGQVFLRARFPRSWLPQPAPGLGARDFWFFPSGGRCFVSLFCFLHQGFTVSGVAISLSECSPCLIFLLP
jgi:hypothetical protein